MVLPPMLMSRDTRGVAGLATVLQQLPQSQMPFQVYSNYTMGTLQVSSFSELNLPPIGLYMRLSVIVYAFYFQSVWIPFSSMGAQPLGFASLQPFGAYIHPGDDPRSVHGMH